MRNITLATTHTNTHYTRTSTTKSSVSSVSSVSIASTASTASISSSSLNSTKTNNKTRTTETTLNHSDKENIPTENNNNNNRRKISSLSSYLSSKSSHPLASPLKKTKRNNINSHKEQITISQNKMMSQNNNDNDVDVDNDNDVDNDIGKEDFSFAKLKSAAQKLEQKSKVKSYQHQQQNKYQNRPLELKRNASTASYKSSSTSSTSSIASISTSGSSNSSSSGSFKLTSYSSLGTTDSGSGSGSGSAGPSVSISSTLGIDFVDDCNNTRIHNTHNIHNNSSSSRNVKDDIRKQKQQQKKQQQNMRISNKNNNHKQGDEVKIHNNKNKKTVNENEDFSFQKLKQKALGMEKASGASNAAVSASANTAITMVGGTKLSSYINSHHDSSTSTRTSIHTKATSTPTKLRRDKGQVQDEDENQEDFSFSKLKEKAQQAPSTPIRKKINAGSGIGTPSRMLGTPVRKGGGMSRIAPHTVCAKTRLPLVPPTIDHIVPFKRSTSTPKKRVNGINNGSIESLSTSSLSHQVPAHVPTSISGTSTPQTEMKNTKFNNPSRFQFKPKIKKEEVQATNNSIASVQKLSKWLSDDPFDKRKTIHIRKGEGVANKSRAFEHEELVNGKLRMKKESRVQQERQYFPEGKVSQSKDWLQNRAFGEKKEGEDVDEKDDQHLGVMEKRKLIESAFKKKQNGMR